MNVLATFRSVHGRDRLRFIILLALMVVEFPLMFVFYLIQSAWASTSNVSAFLRRSQVCVHGVDRVRHSCQSCDDMELAKVIAEHLTDEGFIAQPLNMN